MKETQASILKKKQKILDEIGCCNSVITTCPKYFDFFRSLLEQHPEYKTYLNDVYDICIKQNPTWKNKDVFLKIKNLEDKLISLNSCIKGKSSTLKDNLQIAMRNSIEPQIINFRNSSPLICDICKCACHNNTHIDHREPQFVELFEDFISRYDKSSIPKDFGRDEGNRKIFSEKHKSFKNEWCEYHCSKANLRVLCKQCNLRRPKKQCKISLQ